MQNTNVSRCALSVKMDVYLPVDLYDVRADVLSDDPINLALSLLSCKDPPSFCVKDSVLFPFVFSLSAFFLLFLLPSFFVLATSLSPSPKIS